MGYTPLLTQRAVVLFGLEDVPNVQQAVSPASNALLVDSPDYAVNPQKIERKFSKADLSPFPFRIGRITAEAKFKHELRGNGLEQSSNLAQAPMIANLFAACGFKLVAAQSATDRTTVFPDLANIGAAQWAVGGVPTNVEPVTFNLTCTTAGNAAAAKFTLTANNPDLLAAPVLNVAASGAIPLGTTGVSVTPTVVTNFAVGDMFRVSIMPEGIACVPVSANQKTATILMYFDGLLHTMTGAYGTFQFTAKSGGTVEAEFTFQGTHKSVVDSPMPANAVYDTVLPPIFENALITWNDNTQLAIESLMFNMGGKMSARDDANNPLGYRGYQYTDRAPSGSVNPEATLVANQDFWGDFAAASQKYMMARVGTQPGNQIIMEMPRAQAGSIKYADRNSNRVNDIALEFARVNGDDEVRFFFC